MSETWVFLLIGGHLGFMINKMGYGIKDWHFWATIIPNSLLATLL